MVLKKVPRAIKNKKNVPQKYENHYRRQLALFLERHIQ